jgi:hypothetical protein
MLRFPRAISFSLIVVFLSHCCVSAQDMYAITGAANVESILYQISPVTGQVTHTVGDLGTTHVTALAFSPITGVLFGHISNAPTTTELITIDRNTAAFTNVGNTGQQVPDMSFRSDGVLFAWSKQNVINNTTDNAYRIDTNTAQAVLLGNSNFTSTQVGLSFAPNGTLFMKNGNDLYTVDQQTGGLTFVMTLTGPALVNALAFDDNGTPYSVERTGTHSFLATFNMNTGVITTLGEITASGQPVNGVSALAFNFLSVPEPATWALLGVSSAMILVGYYWRKRRAANAAEGLI